MSEYYHTYSLYQLLLNSVRVLREIVEEVDISNFSLHSNVIKNLGYKENDDKICAEATYSEAKASSCQSFTGYRPFSSKNLIM